MTSFSSFDRAKRQDSPTFWLSLLAGSLALHLFVLLVGRWYFSRTATIQTAASGTPIELVNIDPKTAPASRSSATASSKADSSSRAATQSPSAPVETPSASSPANNSPQIQSRVEPSSITRSPAQVDRSTPKPSASPLKEPLKPASGQASNPRAPIPTNNGSSNSTTPDSQTPGTQPSGSSTGNTPNPENSSQSSSGSNSGASTSPGAPSTSQPGSNSSEGTSPSTAPSSSPNPDDPVSSGKPLPSVPSPEDSGSEDSGNETTLQAEIVGSIKAPQLVNTNVDNNGGRGGAQASTAKSATLKSTLEPITFARPRNIGPEQVLLLKVIFTTDNERKEFAELIEVSEDSPTLQKYPNLDRDKLKEIAKNVLWGAKFDLVIEPGPDGTISPESPWEALLRISLSP